MTFGISNPDFKYYVLAKICLCFFFKIVDLRDIKIVHENFDSSCYKKQVKCLKLLNVLKHVWAIKYKAKHR